MCCSRPIWARATITSSRSLKLRERQLPRGRHALPDLKVLLEVSEDLVGAMKGLAVAGMDEAQMLQTGGGEFMTNVTSLRGTVSL